MKVRELLRRKPKPAQRAEDGLKQETAERLQQVMAELEVLQLEARTYQRGDAQH